ncbi:dihydropyrimidinase [Collinsella sp. An2]|uniref:dihydropyrimidinase n=1 Tax=Collinsella sp. An2 TaxID=1965585 RepID=UPI000B3AD695|nr:dihydropyrimidinase [Collinsella sp. An2]OUP08705.1 dihydropyrimidinase [Collinsella sp. An2]
MIIIRNGTLVLPEGLVRGDIALEGGHIARIASCIAPAEGDEVHDAAGCWVMPGFIDGHTHLQCWTGMDWTADSFETGTRAAACGGTTTIVDYATADRGVTMPDALAEWHRRADGTCTANYAFHMAISEWGEGSLEQMDEVCSGGVRSFKTYLAYDHLRLDDAQTLEVLEAVRDRGGVLCVHCENGTLVNELQRRVISQGIVGPEGHPLSRPAAVEAEAISRLLYLAHLAGDAPVNVVHLSTELGLRAIREAKARGRQNIHVETCPQYLVLDDERYLEEGDDGFAGAKYVMSPPLRKPSDRRALRQAVLAGEIETIATDHCSFNLHGQKDRGRPEAGGDFTKIPNGGPGIEHRPAVIATTFEGELGPCDLVRLMSENPARVFSMWPRKGRLAEGADADVVVWDPAARWTISAATQQQAVDYTPYEGFEAHGRAHLVFVNGRLVARDGEPTGERPGAYVAR